MLPLSGVRVLDLGQGVAGPYCGMLLADYGAEVIKVEPPRGDWGRTLGRPAAGRQGSTYLSVNRNKRALCLDLKQPKALDILHRLAAGSDVLIESFRPDVAARMGFGYEAVRATNPRILYCSISGFGASGPYAGLPAGDSTMQAVGGLMSIIGGPDDPPTRVGNVVSDMLGGMNAFQGLLLALIQRAADGQSRHVTTSLLDSIVAFQAPTLTEFLTGGVPPTRAGNDHPLIAPSGVVETVDGAIVITVLQHQWSRFCAVLGLEHLAGDPRFASNQDRLENRDDLKLTMAPVFLGGTRDAWIERLRANDILCAPINDYPALLADPQVRENALIRRGESAEAVPMVRNPVRVSGLEVGYQPAPLLGGDSAAILRDRLGCSDAELAALEAEGVIVAAHAADAPAVEAETRPKERNR